MSWDTIEPGHYPPVSLEDVTLDMLIPDATPDDIPRVTIGSSTGINPTMVRAHEAWRLRQQGLSYRQIAERLGRTHERCRQLVKKAERRIVWAAKYGREPQW
jgi:hypothetical protein